MYCEQVFADLESAQVYADQTNRDWTEQAQRNNWASKNDPAPYFAAPLPADVALPEMEQNKMERIEFNTGRKYAANGQNIVAVCDGKKVWFKDEARLIQGSFEVDEFDTFDRKTVMFRYDNNQYRMDMFPCA